jgi:hypothetical protein
VGVDKDLSPSLNQSPSLVSALPKSRLPSPLCLPLPRKSRKKKGKRKTKLPRNCHLHQPAIVKEALQKKGNAIDETRTRTLCQLPYTSKESLWRKSGPDTVLWN